MYFLYLDKIRAALGNRIEEHFDHIFFLWDCKIIFIVSLAIQSISNVSKLFKPPLSCPRT